jgi:hypothetical protein
LLFSSSVGFGLRVVPFSPIPAALQMPRKYRRTLAASSSVPTVVAKTWHAHEGWHTAVSIMSSNGVAIQEISDTVEHKSTHVTETVYRHVIVPAIRGGAAVMDSVFDNGESLADVGINPSTSD